MGAYGKIPYAGQGDSRQMHGLLLPADRRGQVMPVGEVSAMGISHGAQAGGSDETEETGFIPWVQEEICRFSRS